MDERLRFVASLLDGEKMAPLCAEYGISRKTGYKIYDRYKTCGIDALTDRSRRPYRQANRLPAPIEATIVRLKRDYPGWGAPKIREKLRQQAIPALQLPAISTVHAVLDRHGLVQRRRRRPQRQGGDGPVAAGSPQRAVVRRLQGRVPVGESPLLLSPDHHGLRHALPARLRGVVEYPGLVRLHRVRARLQGVWTSWRDSHR